MKKKQRSEQIAAVLVYSYLEAKPLVVKFTHTTNQVHGTIVRYDPHHESFWLDDWPYPEKLDDFTEARLLEE
ncbi:hypothetical protein IV38_GL001793 [Lactobacillus selangorensis]|uniref:Uncharacterized protein n=1 Tax=Lactobacillus selangorensis TaxID=81857 RepID=A0A0R2FQ93_9LACO|nr:hypothetical protein [Lactobacillus selangorensis]KRN27953.1 hypothetical protein IV38_GL001793 [Lactobacillus selangorensis]KRN30576.1 hypothetical protein IV40_GL001763 [Lactobacillus selangorensis]